jgi:hypothetical protein
MPLNETSFTGGRLRESAAVSSLMRACSTRQMQGAFPARRGLRPSRQACLGWLVTQVRFIWTMPPRSGGRLACRRGRHLAARRCAQNLKCKSRAEGIPPGGTPSSTAGETPAATVGVQGTRRLGGVTWSPVSCRASRAGGQRGGSPHWSPPAASNGRPESQRLRPSSAFRYTPAPVFGFPVQ